MDARSEMELREDVIRAHYPQALSLLSGFDHAPRLGKAAPATAPERSPGVARTSRFRSTTPGLAGRSTARASGVQVIDRIEGVGGDDLPSPAAATVARALRRALAIALAVVDEIAARSGAAELKRSNLEGRLPAERRGEFGELLAVESLAALSVFANATAFLLSEQAGADMPDGVEAEEILTDNPLVALQGALWDLDRHLARATDDKTLIATAIAYAEALSVAAQGPAPKPPRASPPSPAPAGAWQPTISPSPVLRLPPARAASR